MFFGNKTANQNKTMPAPQPGADSFDVSTESFEAAVLGTSMTTPVLVDFWAPWCGPCKQLMPVLEAAVQAAGGRVKLAKVNIDENPELAQALQVKSVPTVFAFFQGRPVTAFMGARPAGEIKMLIDQLVKMAGGPAAAAALDIPAVLKQAGETLAAGDAAQAQALYAAILEQDENNAAAFAGVVRTYIAAGETVMARGMIDNAPAAIVTTSDFAAARTALELAESAPSGDTQKLAAAVEKNPADHQARFDLSLALFAAGQKGEAVDHLVEIIRRNRTWEEDKARQQLLKFFEAMGPADPETSSGRRKLSTVLFS